MKRSLAFAACCLLLVSGCEKLGLGSAKEETKPVSAKLLSDRGFQMIANKKAADSLTFFDQAIASDSKYVRAYQGKGIALNELGQHEEAEEIYGTALSINPNATSVKNNLAMSKILRGKYQEAIDVLSPIAQSQPENNTVQENLALAHCLSGKKNEARKIYAQHLTPAEVEDNLRFCSNYDKMRKQGGIPAKPSAAATPPAPMKPVPIVETSEPINIPVPEEKPAAVEKPDAKQEWQGRKFETTP